MDISTFFNTGYEALFTGISAVIMLIDQLQIRKERKQLQKIFEEDFKKLRESVLKLEENTTKK